jgi:hypothetical protein
MHSCKIIFGAPFDPINQLAGMIFILGLIEIIALIIKIITMSYSYPSNHQNLCSSLNSLVDGQC